MYLRSKYFPYFRLRGIDMIKTNKLVEEEYQDQPEHFYSFRMPGINYKGLFY